jgi:hypothetical protein
MFFFSCYTNILCMNEINFTFNKLTILACSTMWHKYTFLSHANVAEQRRLVEADINRDTDTRTSSRTPRTPRFDGYRMQEQHMSIRCALGEHNSVGPCRPGIPGQGG